MPLLTGPRIPAKSGKASELVVLLHGYGADGNDLIGLASYWQKRLPGAAFVAPNAPQRLAGGPGFQWFPIARLDPHEVTTGVALAAPAIAQFLDAELARHGVAPERLALAGFSQGAMLALHLGLRRTIAPAAIVGFSGILADPPSAEGLKTPILLTHGGRDTLIPAEAMVMAAASLGAAGLSVQWHLSPETAHGIDESALALAGNFLALAFAGRLESAGPISCPL